MKFALGGFAVVSDVLPCSDPWGQGMTFRMHRWGSRRHKDYQKKRMEGDPLTARALAKMMKRGLAQARAAHEPKLVNPTVEVVANGNGHAVETPPRDEMTECLWEAMEEALDKGNANVFDMFASVERERDEIIALCEGWSGVLDETGAEVAFSPDALAELLDCDAVVREGLPREGETVGDALTKHLLDFVREHSITRSRYLEAGEKNSVGSSAGA